MKKRMIKGRAWALALLTAVSLLAVRRDAAYGAPGIQVDRTDCSVTFGLPAGNELSASGYYDELKGKELKVSLYRVAEVTIGGKYNVIPEFAELNNSFSYQVSEDGISFSKDAGDGASKSATSKGLGSVNDKTTAEEWSALAKMAETLITRDQLSALRTVSVSGDMTIGGLPTGMYLVSVETARTDTYEYSFVPFLLSLPDNAYLRADAGGIVTGDSDEWLYEAAVTLKPERVDRYGRLVISKTLNNYNRSLGDAVFGFEITARKGEGENARVVYNNVVSLKFSEGSDAARTVTVDRIPAGSVAEVREIYEGSSYRLVSSTGTDGILIVADGADTEGAEPVSSGTASFVNEYDGGLKGGAGVENQFIYGGGENGEAGQTWNWVRPQEPASPQEPEAE